jgi:DoxX
MIDASTAPYAAVVLRLALGILFLAHGLLKLLVFKPAGAYAYFKSLGVPGWLAYVTMAAELAGAAALIVGFMPRYAALALASASSTRADSNSTWLADGHPPAETAMLVGCAQSRPWRIRRWPRAATEPQPRLSTSNSTKECGNADYANPRNYGQQRGSPYH